jgi:hypothetical protein
MFKIRALLFRDLAKITAIVGIQLFVKKFKISRIVKPLQPKQMNRNSFIVHKQIQHLYSGKIMNTNFKTKLLSKSPTRRLTKVSP